MVQGTETFVGDQHGLPLNMLHTGERSRVEEVTSHGDLDDVYMWIGPDLHLVQYPVRRGEL